MKANESMKPLSCFAAAWWLVLLSCVAIAVPQPGLAASSKPNIILCMADDQGWGDMGYYGHPVLKTPSFDALAKEGVRFDHFYAAAPVCSPTRGSVMTGRHPNRYGCFSYGYSLRPQEITIAEALKNAGYVTGHFGKWHLGTVYKNSPVNPGASGFEEWLSAPNFFDNDPILSQRGVAKQFKGESSMVTVDAALEFIREKAKGDKPFLAVVWFGSPHKPHIASELEKEQYKGQRGALQNYYGEISGMDRAFGKLRAELAKLGLRDNTLLWYCSDNGGLPDISVTGGRGHKGVIYEGGLRVPALLEWPARIPKPFIVEAPCGTSDIYPTLLAIAGVQPRNQPPLDGISLLPLLEEKTKSRSQPMGFWRYPTKGQEANSAVWMEELLKLQKEGKEIEDPARLLLDAGSIKKRYAEDSFPGHAAWLDWPWKLHRIQSPQGQIKYELYNLQADNNEAKDCQQTETNRVDTMKHALEGWQRSVARSLNGKDYH